MRGKRVYPVRLGPDRRRRFLDHLSVTCDVEGAARLIGMPPETLYRTRRKDADFAAGWREALALGYEMIEMRLAGRALCGRTGGDADADAGSSDTFDAEMALKLLARRRVPPAGAAVRRATVRETDAAILKKLAAIAEAKQGQKRARGDAGSGGPAAGGGAR